MVAADVPRLVQLLTPVITAVGCDLEELTVSPAGRRRVVRVLVDRDEGLSLDDVAEVSRSLSEALDDIAAREPALLAGAYVLEVSSPGVDRPLTEPRHWRRNAGRLVTAHLRDGRSVTGRLGALTQTDGTSGVRLGDEQLDLADVVRGQVQVEFGRPGTDGPDDHDADADDHEEDDA